MEAHSSSGHSSGSDNEEDDADVESSDNESVATPRSPASPSSSESGRARARSRLGVAAAEFEESGEEEREEDVSETQRRAEPLAVPIPIPIPLAGASGAVPNLEYVQKEAKRREAERLAFEKEQITAAREAGREPIPWSEFAAGVYIPDASRGRGAFELACAYLEHAVTDLLPPLPSSALSASVAPPCPAKVTLFHYEPHGQLSAASSRRVAALLMQEYKDIVSRVITSTVSHGLQHCASLHDSYLIKSVFGKVC